MEKTTLKPHDIVRVRRCKGIARIEKYIEKYGVYLLDRQMAVEFHGKDNEDNGVVTYVRYWTFRKQDLRKVEVE